MSLLFKCRFDIHGKQLQVGYSRQSFWLAKNGNIIVWYDKKGPFPWPWLRPIGEAAFTKHAKHRKSHLT